MDSQPTIISPRRSIGWMRVALFLTAWVVQVVVLELLVWVLTPRTYTATGLLICRESPHVFGGEEPPTARRTNLERYLSTQAELVTSSDVLAAALVRHPEMTNLDGLLGVQDPEAEMHRLIQVRILPNTNLIEVSVGTRSPASSKSIVDNVVDAYLAAAHTWSDEESREQIVRLTKETQRLDNDINAKRTKLKNLQDRIGSVSPEDLKDQGRMSMDRFQRYLAKVDDLRFERIRLESELEVARLRVGRTSVRPGLAQRGPDVVKTLFSSHPRVAELVKAKQDAAEQLAALMREQKKGANDTEVTAARKKLEDMDAQIASLWRELSPQLLEQTPQEQAEEREVEQLESKLRVVQSEEASLQGHMRLLQVDNTRVGGAALEVEFARRELDKDEQLHHSIRDRIMQLEYEAKGPARVDRANHTTRVDESHLPSMPLVLAMPVVALLIVLPAFPLALHVFRRRRPEEQEADESAA